MAAIETVYPVILKLIARKDFVDVLFSFLTLSLGTIARLVAKEKSNMQPIEVRSLSSLYRSVKNLDKEYLCTVICGNTLAKPISPERPNAFDGFVKRNPTFIITDDLKVVPDSLDTVFYLLKNYGIEDMSLVNEMTMTITENEGVSILQASLTSSSALTAGISHLLTKVAGEN
ncbi:hypothetical protein AAZX31_18G274900 [Glycine max]